MTIMSGDPLVTEPCAIPGLDELVYHADPCPEPSLSSTMAKTILQPGGPARLRQVIEHTAGWSTRGARSNCLPTGLRHTRPGRSPKSTITPGSPGYKAVAAMTWILHIALIIVLTATGPDGLLIAALGAFALRVTLQILANSHRKALS